ncbi:MAG: GatB/YqeY domain-containing protein [Candidatus Nanoperiomorbaceae bacterium]
MSKKDEIQAMFKTAFQAHDDLAKTVLGELKSAILYEEVAQNKKATGLSDGAIEQVVARQIKQREDAATLYRQGGAPDKADQELREKAILVQFLPPQLTDEELTAKVREVAGDHYDSAKRGQLIGAVKKAVGNAADGARVAKAVQRYFA